MVVVSGIFYFIVGILGLGKLVGEGELGFEFWRGRRSWVFFVVFCVVFFTVLVRG